MYNVYTRDRKIKDKRQQLSKEKMLKDNEQNRDILTARYKDRINNTLMSLNKDAKNMPRPPRTQTATPSERSWLKFTGFNSDIERVKDSEKWNQWLDTTPSTKQGLKLRPREKSKEIQPSLRFRAKSGLERVEESISKQKEYLDSSAPPDSKQKLAYKNYFGIEKPVISGGKEVLDYYHFKTYFKTIQSLALDLHSSVRNMSRAQIKKKHMDEKLGMSEAKGKKEIKPEDELCKEDVMPISEELLEKFGFWEVKKLARDKVNRNRYGTPKWTNSQTRTIVD